MLSNQTFPSFFVFYGTATLFLEIIYSLVTSAKREAILFLFGCWEVNSTWLITSELANQRARKTLFTWVVGKYIFLVYTVTVKSALLLYYLFYNLLLIRSFTTGSGTFILSRWSLLAHLLVFTE